MQTSQFDIKRGLLFGFFFVAFLLLSVFLENWILVAIPFLVLLIPAFIQQPLLLFYLLLFVIPVSIEYKFTETLGTDFPDELMMLALSFIFILLFIHRPSILNKKWMAHGLILLLLLQLAWVMIATVYSTNPILSVKYLLAKIWYIIPFVFFPLLFLKDKRSIQIAGWCLLVPLVCLAGLSLMRQAMDGFSFGKVNQALSPYFRNHVNYGAMLAAMLPVSVAFYWLSDKKNNQGMALFTILLLLLALVFSFSRGAWLAVLISLITVWAIRKKIIVHLLSIALIAVSAIFIWLGTNNNYLDYRPNFKKTIFHTNFEQHLAATYRGQDLSTAERFYRWTAVQQMMAENPMTGVGPNNFYDTYKAYTASAYKTWVSDNKEHSTIHNYFFLLLIEQGLPGLGIFLCLLFSLFWYAQKIYHQKQSKWHQTIALTLAAMLAAIITVNFLSDLVETDKIGSLLYCCIGLLVWLDLHSSNQQLDSKQVSHL